MIDYTGKTIRAASKVQLLSKPNYATSNKVTVAKNLYGYVRGLKYYRSATSLSDRIDYFTESEASEAELMLYYRFEQTFYNATGRSFSNLVRNSN